MVNTRPALIAACLILTIAGLGCQSRSESDTLLGSFLSLSATDEQARVSVEQATELLDAADQPTDAASLQDRFVEENAGGVQNSNAPGSGIGQATLPAFPGAEGFGATSKGGRGPGNAGATPQIIYVTTLADQIVNPANGQLVTVPGSLRAAVEASGPRFVIFKVGGVIRLNSKLDILNPYITIAGQTAPSPGIALGRYGLGIGTHDIVVRHVRIRPYIDEDAGDELGDHSRDNVLISKRDSEVQNPATDVVTNVIFDHCSFSWAIDETVDIYNWVRDLTFQWCIFSEASMYGHREGPGGHGVLVNKDPGSPSPEDLTRLSIHHSIFAHCTGRYPRVATKATIDFRNNTAYNWSLSTSAFLAGARANYVGNHFMRGLDSPPAYNGYMSIEVSAPGAAAGTPRLFLRDNFNVSRTSASQPEWDFGVYYRIRNNGILCGPSSTFCIYPVGPDTLGGLFASLLPFATPHVTTHTADLARSLVVQNSGVTRPMRDAVDRRLTDEIAHVIQAQPFSGTNPGADPLLRRLGPHDGRASTVLFFNPLLAPSHYCTPRTYRMRLGESVYTAQLNLLLSLDCSFSDGMELPENARDILESPQAYLWSIDSRIIPEAATVNALYPGTSSQNRADWDDDGIPNSYEINILGTNPYVHDSLLDSNGDGYLNIEQYLNSLAL